MKSGYAIIGIDRAGQTPGSEDFALALSGVDLTSPEESAAAFERIARELGSLHALVSRARSPAHFCPSPGSPNENSSGTMWERFP
jgi:hypothetical protein